MKTFISAKGLLLSSLATTLILGSTALCASTKVCKSIDVNVINLSANMVSLDTGINVKESNAGQYEVAPSSAQSYALIPRFFYKECGLVKLHIGGETLWAMASAKSDVVSIRIDKFGKIEALKGFEPNAFKDKSLAAFVTFASESGHMFNSDRVA